MPCSVCRKAGHNIRTCPVKKEMDKAKQEKVEQEKVEQEKVEQEKEHEKFVEEVKAFDEEEESPSDSWFYGELTEPVKDVDALTKIMVEGIKRFKKYLEVSELEEVCENDELSSTIDSWFDHDSLRNNYFDELIKEHEFDAFCSRVISQAFENN